MSNSLYPDQAQNFVMPDLGPKGLQKLSARVGVIKIVIVIDCNLITFS